MSGQFEPSRAVKAARQYRNMADFFLLPEQHRTAVLAKATFGMFRRFVPFNIFLSTDGKILQLSSRRRKVMSGLFTALSAVTCNDTSVKPLHFYFYPATKATTCHAHGGSAPVRYKPRDRIIAIFAHNYELKPDAQSICIAEATVNHQHT